MFTAEYLIILLRVMNAALSLLFFCLKICLWIVLCLYISWFIVAQHLLFYGNSASNFKIELSLFINYMFDVLKLIVDIFCPSLCIASESILVKWTNFQKSGC